MVEELLEADHAVRVCDLVASETYFALQHHFRMPKAEALEVLSKFFQTSRIKATGAAAEILATPNFASAQPEFVDRMIYAEYVRITDVMLTFEKAARKLPKARVLAR